MNEKPSQEPESNDTELFRQRFSVQLSHRGRVARVLVALFLSTLGLLFPAPYIGWGSSLVLFGPAMVLLGVAGMAPQRRRGVLLCSFPTALRTVLALFSLVSYAQRIGWTDAVPKICGLTLVTSLLALLLGGPPNAK